MLSYCRICAAACGITVTVDGDRVLRVRGDAGHPVSRGYTCSKGRGLAAWHHSDRRLDRPRLRGREVPWDEVLDDLGALVRDTIDSHGADTIALYLATGMAYDAGGQIAAGSFLAALGSSSFYTAVTVDNAPVLVAAELVTGNAMMGPRWDPTTPGLLLLVGTNPIVSHGYGTDDARSGQLPPRPPAGRWSHVGDRSAAHRERRPRRRAPRHPSGHRRARAGRAGTASCSRSGADEDELRDYCAPDDVAALRSTLDPFTIARAAAAAGVDPAMLHGAGRRPPRPSGAGWRSCAAPAR